MRWLSELVSIVCIAKGYQSYSSLDSVWKLNPTWKTSGLPELMGYLVRNLYALLG